MPQCLEHSFGPVRRIDDLTCCRAGFAAWVFLYHLRLQLGAFAAFGVDAVAGRGTLGVDGFFVLSGLVLAHAHPVQRRSLREIGRFWARRLLRIYPVHLAIILLLLLMLIGAGWSGVALRDAGRLGWPELARHVLLLHGWGFSDRWAWNYPSWSISTEWAGYLVFPWLWWAVRGTPVGLCALLAAVMGVVLAHVDAAAGLVGLNLTYEGALWRFFPEFIAGMTVVRLAPPLACAVDGRLITAGGLALGALALGYGCRDWMVVCSVWLALLGTLVAAQQGCRPMLAGIPGLTWLGAISYPFYMSAAVIETVQGFGWRRTRPGTGRTPVGVRGIGNRPHPGAGDRRQALG